MTLISCVDERDDLVASVCFTEVQRLPDYQLAQKGIPWEPMKAHRAITIWPRSQASKGSAKATVLTAKLPFCTIANFNCTQQVRTTMFRSSHQILVINNGATCMHKTRLHTPSPVYHPFICPALTHAPLLSAQSNLVVHTKDSSPTLPLTSGRPLT